MRVMKFGGTSVGSAEALAAVRDIVGRQDGARVVVVSAHSGVTDALLQIAREAAAGSYSLAPIRRRHHDLLRRLGVDPALVDPLLAELEDLLQGLSLVGELTPRSLDLVASYGERMSARGIAAYLRTGGIAADAVDAYDLGLRTDSRHTAANPDRSCFATLRRRLLA
ncbi:MAG: aspartate kinase, partial [Planctomycetota bacterium]